MDSLGVLREYPDLLNTKTKLILKDQCSYTAPGLGTVTAFPSTARGSKWYYQDKTQNHKALM